MLNSKTAMELIIDGYNMIGTDHGLRGPLEHPQELAYPAAFEISQN
jgi:hypothetical protein